MNKCKLLRKLKNIFSIILILGMVIATLPAELLGKYYLAPAGLRDIEKIADDLKSISIPYEYDKQKAEEVLVHIKQLYDPGNVFTSQTIDITSIFTVAMLENGYKPADFPLPVDGNTWAKNKSNYIYIGQKLTRVQLTVIKKDGIVTGIELTGKRTRRWTWDKEQGNFVYQKPKSHQVIAKIRALYEGTYTGRSKTISITGFFNDTNYLRTGYFRPLFPLPDGNHWSDRQGMRIGRKLKRIRMTVIKEDGNVKGMELEGKNKHGIKVSRWNWDEKKGEFIYQEEEPNPVIGKIRALFEKEYEGHSETIDITGLFTASMLNGGRSPWKFPLPDGGEWGGETYLFLGQKLSSVELTVIKEGGKIKSIEFKGINRGEERISRWDWDEKRSEFTYHAETNPVIEKIRSLYTGTYEGRSETIDIAGIFEGTHGFTSGNFPAYFPLPNGKKMGWKKDSHYMYVGRKLQVLKLTVIKEKNAVTGIELQGKGRGNINTSTWDWSEEKGEFKLQRDVVIRKIRELYEGHFAGSSEAIDITDLFKDTAFLKEGSFPAFFPLPDGKEWGTNSEKMRLGKKLSSVKLKVVKKDGKVTSIILEGSKQRGSITSRWDWYEEEGRFKYQKETPIIAEIRKLYEGEYSGRSETIDITDIFKNTDKSRMPYTFPLPDGAYWGERMNKRWMYLGKGVKRVKLTVIKQDGVVKEIKFEGIKKGPNKKSSWYWDETSGIYVYCKNPYIEMIRSLYKWEYDGPSETLDITGLFKNTKLLDGGYFTGIFPLPDGSMLGGTPIKSMHIGGSLIKVKLTVIKEDGRVKEIKLEGKNKWGIKRSRWKWDEQRKKIIFIKEENQVVKIIQKLYEEKFSGRSETIDITDLFSPGLRNLGVIPADFPLPNEGRWGGTKATYMHISTHLKSIALTVIKEHGKIVGIELHGDNGRTVKTSQWIWNEIRGKFVFHDEGKQEFSSLFLKGRIFEEIVLKVYKEKINAITFEKQFLLSTLTQEYRYPDYFAYTVLIADAKWGLAPQDIVDTLLKYNRLKKMCKKEEPLKIVVLNAFWRSSIEQVLKQVEIDDLSYDIVSLEELMKELNTDENLAKEVNAIIKNMEESEYNPRELEKIYESLKAGRDAAQRQQVFTLIEDKRWQEHLVQLMKKQPWILRALLQHHADNHSLFWEWSYHMRLITLLSYMFDKIEEIEMPGDNRDDIRTLIQKIYPDIPGNKDIWKKIVLYYKYLHKERKIAMGIEEHMDEGIKGKGKRWITREELLWEMDKEESRMWGWNRIRADKFNFQEFARMVTYKSLALSRILKKKKVTLPDITDILKKEIYQLRYPIEIIRTLELIDSEKLPLEFFSKVEMHDPYDYFDKLKTYVEENQASVSLWPDARKERFIDCAWLAFHYHFTIIAWEYYKSIEAIVAWKENPTYHTLNYFMELLKEVDSETLIIGITGNRLYDEFQEFLELFNNHDFVEEPVILGKNSQIYQKSQ